MTLSPPYAWVLSFCSSTGTALGQSLTFELGPTKTPLLSRLSIRWEEPIGPELRMGVWNLLQIWASKNGVQPQGRPIHSPNSMTVEVATDRRFGAPRNTHPLG